ncbi:MAG: cellulose biosynthesis protein BcsG [Gallionella sp.]|nr:cellulose biosynthesis protein BcsG [Gallionella sp.]
MHKTPSWSNYLNKLGEQVKQPHPAERQSPDADEQLFSKDREHKPELRQAGIARNNDSVNVRRRKNAISPNEPTLPIGNRRTRAEQRHDPLAHTSPLPETPSWANYLNKLGEQALSEHEGENQNLSAPVKSQPAGMAQNHDRVNTAQPRNAISPNEAPLPIGNRRTHAEQRRDLSAQPAFEHKPYWAVCLNWFWLHIKRPVTSRQLSGTGAHTLETNGHGKVTTPDNETRHARSLTPVPPLPKGEEYGSSLRELHVNAAFHTRISLGIWGYYFSVKLALFWMDLIPFHPLENLALALFILFSSSSQFLQRTKNTLIFVAALTLLYYDTWLPPISSVVSQASSLYDFKFSYLVELISRFISLPVIAVLLTVCLSYWIVSYRLRVGALVISCLAALYLFEYPVPNLVSEPARSVEQSTAAYSLKPDMDKVEQTFFENEAQRSIWLPIPQADAVPFDVLFIQVCSLSWDDVRYADLDQHPLWRRFDILLTKFNSATSYSGPAAIRLLRAPCGQPKHTSMYLPADDNCYLMDNLSNSGFETNFALNHTGRFDDFLGTVKAHGHLTVAPMTLNGLDVAQRAFDDAPVYDDLKVLNRWLETRQKSASSRVALFYNTVSLHDGNHLLGTESLQDTSPNTLQTYRNRLRTFLDEMEQFMQSLEKSGRRALIVMVPEHGGAIRGDSRQISGLREIPTPAITLVPVGIKVIGGNIQRAGETLLIDQATSYLAISHIVARMLEDSPFSRDTFAPSAYVADLPTTQFVAQTQSATVIEESGRLYLKQGSSGWEDYTEPDTSVDR